MQKAQDMASYLQSKVLSENLSENDKAIAESLWKNNS
jgi:hypothetical protein